jgi:hypothetical protein
MNMFTEEHVENAGWGFTRARNLFPTAHILASLPENELAPPALRHIFRRALHCGGAGSRKNLQIAPCETPSRSFPKRIGI